MHTLSCLSWCHLELWFAQFRALLTLFLQLIHLQARESLFSSVSLVCGEMLFEEMFRKNKFFFTLLEWLNSWEKRIKIATFLPWEKLHLASPLWNARATGKILKKCCKMYQSVGIKKKKLEKILNFFFFFLLHF